MTTKIHFGDEVTHPGDHSVGMIQTSGRPDPRVTFQELTAEVRVLREQLPPAQRQSLDDALRTISAGTTAPTGPDADDDAVRRALAIVAGVARAAGHAGAPVMDALLRVCAGLDD